MFYKVIHCVSRILANTWPHQLFWGDREMGTSFSYKTKDSQVMGLLAVEHTMVHMLLLNGHMYDDIML